MNIDGTTKLFGIIGNPVAHSLSPAMHNAAFGACGLNHVYVPFQVSDVQAALAGLVALGVSGVSVTIPHKQRIIEYLDAVDPVAAAIGAVNTIVIDHRQGGIARGSNTDWVGANRALQDHIELSGARVTLIGAGGAARAIAFGLQEAGARITIASRNETAGRELAEAVGGGWLSLTRCGAEAAADILINATSVGMEPQQDQSPVISNVLDRFKVVMDIVYAPAASRSKCVRRGA